MINIALIVAAADNGCIGVNNTLPWRLPEDLKYFKRMTMGKPVIMGRKTFDSIGKPLPGRTNIVITHNAHFAADGIQVALSLDDAVQQAEAVAARDRQDEVMVIGGETIYALCLPRANRLYYTHVHAQVEGDAFFPPVNWCEWNLISREDHPASGNNPFDYRFCVYERV